LWSFGSTAEHLSTFPNFFLITQLADGALEFLFCVISKKFGEEKGQMDRNVNNFSSFIEPKFDTLLREQKSGGWKNKKIVQPYAKPNAPKMISICKTFSGQCIDQVLVYEGFRKEAGYMLMEGQIYIVSELGRVISCLLGAVHRSTCLFIKNIYPAAIKNINIKKERIGCKHNYSSFKFSFDLAELCVKSVPIGQLRRDMVPSCLEKSDRIRFLTIAMLGTGAVS
jgi:hypothetical protein